MFALTSAHLDTAEGASFDVEHSLSPRQIEIVKAGGLIAQTAQRLQQAN